MVCFIFLAFSLRLAYLELGKSETTTGTDSTVILDSGSSHNRTQLVGRTGGKSRSLCGTSLATVVLTTGLIHCQFLLIRFKVTPKFFLFNSGRKKRGISAIPGQNERAHDAASPCGSLKPVISPSHLIHLISSHRIASQSTIRVFQTSAGGKRPSLTELLNLIVVPDTLYSFKKNSVRNLPTFNSPRPTRNRIEPNRINSTLANASTGVK